MAIVVGVLGLMAAIGCGFTRTDWAAVRLDAGQGRGRRRMGEARGRGLIGAGLLEGSVLACVTPCALRWSMRRLNRLRGACACADSSALSPCEGEGRASESRVGKSPINLQVRKSGPRAGGGVPNTPSRSARAAWWSPRRRGRSAPQRPRSRRDAVVPAHAGVFRQTAAAPLGTGHRLRPPRPTRSPPRRPLPSLPHHPPSRHRSGPGPTRRDSRDRRDRRHQGTHDRPPRPAQNF